MNSRIFDTPASKELPELRAQLKDNIDRFGEDNPVLIRPNDSARQERIIDVLNSAAAAGKGSLSRSTAMDDACVAASSMRNQPNPKRS